MKRATPRMLPQLTNMHQLTLYIRDKNSTNTARADDKIRKA